MQNPKKFSSFTLTLFNSTIRFFWKTLPTSEWVKLLAVPLILSFSGSIIASQLQRENRQNEIIDKYFDQVEELFLHEDLDLSNPKNHLRILIKSRSVSALRSTDLKRKEVIIAFLSESNLLNYRDGVILSNLDLTESYFDITKIKNNLRGLKTINLSGLQLAQSDFRNTFFKNANFFGTNLQYARLNNANFEGSNFENANLEDARLNNANLKGANLEFANLQDARLKDAILIDTKFHFTSLEGAYIVNANLKGANLKYAILIEASLDDANLSGTDLDHANFSGAHLIYTNFSGANLSNTDFSNANLYGVNFYGANLTNANINNYQIKLACFWQYAIYEGNSLNNKANQEYIQKLKQDELSNPEENPDCSKWEQN